MLTAGSGPADVLFKDRPFWLLLAVSLTLGTAHALTFLPLPLILGHGPFWEFPAGTVPGSLIDMGQAYSGYLYLVQAPWTLPLLHVPNLDPPTGQNTFWLDPVPWVGLIGKLIFSATGRCLNLLGIFLFLCFMLPGVAMTFLFRTTGRRGLIFAIAGSLLTNAMPLLLFEWGHIALCAHFLPILAIALYLQTQRYPNDLHIMAGWLVLLTVTALTHMYLFVMVGGCWSAAIVQKGLNRRESVRGLTMEALATIGLLLCIMTVTGILNPDLQSGGTRDFGIYSLNLGSPLVPQLSGVLPPLRTYWIGMRSQVFGYVGLGALAVILISIPHMPEYFGAAIRSHLAMTCVFIIFFLFALSNRITFGSHILLEIPLPDRLAYGLGTFRASGRFFWPVAYTVLAMAILVIADTFQCRTTLAVLGLACILQLIDAGPVRNAVATSSRHALAQVFDRGRAEERIGSARALMIFPTAGCLDTEGNDAQLDRRLLQAVVELELAAARHNLPVNSVVRPRIATDCRAELNTKRQGLRPGTDYFYLTPFTAGPDQLNGLERADVCSALDWLQVCRIPDEAAIAVSHERGPAQRQ